MSQKLQTTRRGLLKTAAAGGLLAATPLASRFASAQSSAPIKIGFQQHSTGIGAAYGRWYGRTTEAAGRVETAAGERRRGGPADLTTTKSDRRLGDVTAETVLAPADDQIAGEVLALQDQLFAG